MTRALMATCASASLASLIAVTATAATDTPPITYTGAGGAVVEDSQFTPLTRDGSSQLWWLPSELFVSVAGASPPELLSFFDPWWGNGNALSFPAGAEIGPDSDGEWGFGGYYAQDVAWTPSGIYMGFRVIIEGQYHYGWIHFGVETQPQKTRLHGWALHDLPDTPITTGEIPYLPPSDIDGDGVVDGADLGLLLTAWGAPGIGDLDANGVVDGADLGLLLQAWGRSATPCGVVDSLCFAAQEPGVVGCAGASCCAVVCGIDPHCCAVQWDQLCVDRALSSCGTDGWPIECQTVPGHASDCNGNGIVDACEVAAGLISDADCDGDGMYDWCTLLLGLDTDCNGNGIPDQCDLASGVLADCTGSGIPDLCEIAQGLADDCNGNGIPDLCEIAQGLADDCNGDGIPDICQGAAPVVGNVASLRFDEPAHVNVGPMGDFGAQIGQSTVEFWFRSDNTQAIMAPVKIIDDRPGSGDPVYSVEFNRSINGCIPVGLSPGRTLFFIRDNNLKVLAGEIDAPILDGQWHHISWRVIDAATNQMEVYIDGVLEPFVATCDQSPNAFTPWSDFLTLGAANNRGTIESHHTGNLDEVRIFSVARTPAEIMDNWYLEIAPTTPGLVGYWRFDEASGTMAFDETGSHDGTLIGPPIWSESLDCDPR